MQPRTLLRIMLTHQQFGDFGYLLRIFTVELMVVPSQLTMAAT
ncbi:hypothetical protein BN439_2798 [Erwinia amylovora Ea644]|nr:hypothetical protein BN439_2798 [Erwinia amylovora Ea644]CCP07905.1 hypothetical protein BN440_2892 [Erwinia amylovora MR1]